MCKTYAHQEFKIIRQRFKRKSNSLKNNLCATASKNLIGLKHFQMLLKETILKFN